MAQEILSVHQADNVLLAIGGGLDELHHPGQNGPEIERLVAIPENIVVCGHDAAPAHGA